MSKARRATATANPHRGEVVIHVSGEPLKLCVTMNALVEIEEGLGVPLAKMGEVLKTPTMKHLRLIIGALVRGGGADMSDEDLGRHMIPFDEAVIAIAKAFEAAGVFTPGAPEQADPNAARPT